MNKKILAASLSALILTTSAASCGGSAAKSGEIGDVASAAKKYIEDDYSGIISSDTKYSLTDSETMTLRRKIRDKSNCTDIDWMIIVDDGEYEIYYAEGWDKKAKGYKGAENDDGLTMKELYKENVSEFKDTSKKELGIGKYLDEQKRDSADSDALTLQHAMSSVFGDLEDEGVNTYGIGYIIIESGKITELNSEDPTSRDELIKKIESAVTTYDPDFGSIDYAIAFCGYGDVSYVFIGDSADSDVLGSYPNYDESVYGRTMSNIFDLYREDFAVDEKTEQDIYDDLARNMYYSVSYAADDAVYYKHYDEDIDVKSLTITKGVITDAVYTGETDKATLLADIQEEFDENFSYYMEDAPELAELTAYALLKYNYVDELYLYDENRKIIGTYPEKDSHYGGTIDTVIKDKTEEYALNEQSESSKQKVDAGG